MKRGFLLSLAALCAASFSTKAVAQSSCAEAITMPMMVTNGDGSVRWYNYTATMDCLFPSSTPANCAADAIQIFEDCNGTEAVKLNDNSYYLESGKSYKVRLVPQAGQMWMLMGLPTANAPEGMYCFKPVVLTTETWNQYQTQNNNTTKWYSIPVAYPAPVVITAHTTENPVFHNDGIVTKVVTKQTDCKGVTNESNDLLPNRAYAKAGTALVAVTVGDKAFTNIGFSLDAMSAAGCNNGPTHITAITIDTENTYPDAPWTLYRRFVIPEDGNYTITNHGAEGTIMRVGKLVENACDFDTTPLQATVGEDNEAEVVGEFKAGDIVIIESDAFAKLGSNPYLKIVKGGTTTGIIKTQTSSRVIGISQNPNNGTFVVKSYLLNNGATVAVYDMAARKVYSATAQPGTDEKQINLNVAAGQYLVVVYGAGRSASAQIVVK